MSLKTIFTPLRIGTIEVPNRIVRTAHGTDLARDVLTEDFIEYHAARARGGCGLSILEATSVHPSSLSTLANTDDRVIPGFAALMKAVRPHGMRVFQQLFHGGHNTPGGDMAPPWAPSAIPNPVSGIVPMAMGQPEIDSVVAGFAAAARRCREGGLDGVEIHAAHGYLLHEFLSPLTNRRTDTYGGALANRLRILQEVLRAVQGVAGPGFVVGVRVSASQAEGGIGEAELVSAIAALVEEKLIDFLDVSLGDYYRMDTMVSGMQAPLGYELPSSRQITAGVPVPRIVGGRVRTLEEAEQILRDGVADMVSLVRAQIADPDLIRKTREGRADEVRPCIACNQGCIGGLIRDHRLACAVNPTAGFEVTLSEDKIRRVATPRKVLVIGGGPAGMEAARVAALAGHKVTLAEASSSLGGAINVARRAPRLHTIGDITHWLEQEVYRLGVAVRLGSYLEPDDVLAEAADVVVVATGSSPRMDGEQFSTPARPARGHDLPHVISSIDLLTDNSRALGKSALVLDDTGHYEAIAAAEFLIERGLAVTYLTRHASFAPYVETTMRNIPALERLHRGDFTVLSRHYLAEIQRDTCLVRPLQAGDNRLREIPADTVVLVTPNVPERGLYDALRDRHQRIVLVGDALAPRDLQNAIRDGHRAARAIV